MKIISNESDTTPMPNAQGTPNATQDIYHHIKPGRKRANFFRYFRFNLPRLTKVVLLLVITVLAACSAKVALSNHLPFRHADIALWLVVAACIIYLCLALTTKLAIWDFGSLIGAGAAIFYIGSVTYGNAPFVWNGASTTLAACWNTILFCSLIYFLLNWAINFGMLVVWPDTQGFTD